MSEKQVVKPKQVLWDPTRPEYYTLVWENGKTEIVKVIPTK